MSTVSALRLRTLLAKLRADESGSALIEFAFVLTPLLILMLGGLDLGYQAYLRAVMQGALNDLARSGSMEAPNIGCTGNTVEQRLGCALRQRSDLVARHATYTVKVSNFYDFSTVGRSEKLVTDYNHNGKYNTGDCFVDLNSNGQYDANAGRTGIGGADDVVFYQVTLSMPRLLPLDGLLGFPPNYQFTSQTAIRSQPYARQQTPPTVCI